jgi:outer membrane scaffolding protein for murein synthesis (MipA/OmpV family)
MKKKLIGLIAACLATPTFAQEAAPPQPLWEAGIGAGWIDTPAYPGADAQSHRGLAIPFLIYRGEVLRSDQGGIGARLLHSDTTEFDIGFSASLPAHSKDVAARAGMPDLGTLVEFGPRLKVKLLDIDPRSGLRAELPLRAVMELKSGVRRQGWTVEPRLVYATREDTGKWTLDAQLGAVFGDARIHRYFYEVAPQYATIGRPAYEARSGLTLVRTGLSGTWRVDRDLRTFAFTRYETYAGAANRDSPLMKKSSGFSVGIGLAYTLGRSQAPARD